MSIKNKCTRSKNNQKDITRYVYKDEVNQKRFKELFKTEYSKRKKTTERILGVCKEQHSLRFTRVKGLEKNLNQALLIFACHNLKKMSLWQWEKKQKKKKSMKSTFDIIQFFQKLRKILQF
ncbi:MAG: hypothetical protein HFI09_02625 [Bacilli bacterium]|nr:hypothetical protein [Bacilli bacterium]